MVTLLRPAALAAVALAVSALPVSAQRLTFQRTYDVDDAAALDVSTIRGRVDVAPGPPGRILVVGTVTVRPFSASRTDPIEIARRIAADPPVTQQGSAVRLQPPDGEEARGAVTVSYVVTVPADTAVRASSESGALAIEGVSGHVDVDTSSSTIDLRRLAGSAEAASGSGAIRVDGIAGDLSVTTRSSAIQVAGAAGAVRARSQSGAVDVRLAGDGHVDVETSSSAIGLSGLQGGLRATSQSGRIRIAGAPTAAWNLSSGSGSFDFDLDPGARLDLAARTRSGSVRVGGVSLEGAMAKGEATGSINGGGPLVTAISRSGSITVSAR